MASVPWEELGAAALARQLPELPARNAAAVPEMLRLVGPVQSQTARSPFIGLAARFPGITHEAVTSAYEAFEIVRGSVIRGTVHTCAAEHHPLLEVATRAGQRQIWLRTLKVDERAVDQLWQSLEEHARHEWRTPAELFDHLVTWVQAHGGVDALEKGLGRYLGFGHGGLVRRPLKGGWDRQGAPGYRAAAALLPGDRAAALADPHALDELVRVHVRAHGPSSRQDLAWWAGIGLTRVDEVLARLELPTMTGPDGEEYVDLPDAPAPREVPGVRLLPEFDALMCAYAPAARQRFMSPAIGRRLWNLNNGMVMPPVLVDGRITGYWRAPGSARKRPMEVVWFAGTRRPRTSELEEPVAALEQALAITVTDVRLTREAL
jgi:hypothetical protein